MKKLLLMTILALPVFASDTITVLDSEKGGIRVLCINQFVFVTRQNGGMTQMWLNGNIPLRCKAYENMKKQNN